MLSRERFRWKSLAGASLISSRALYRSENEKNRKSEKRHSKLIHISVQLYNIIGRFIVEFANKVVETTRSNRRRQWKRRYGHLGRKTGKLTSVGSSVRSLLTTSTPENLSKEFHQHDQPHRPSFCEMDDMKPTGWNSRDKFREPYTALKARIKCNKKKKNNIGFKRLFRPSKRAFENTRTKHDVFFAFSTCECCPIIRPTLVTGSF